MNDQPSARRGTADSAATGAWEPAASAAGASATAVREALREQESRWRRGDRVPVEQLIAVRPDCQAADAVFELVHNEIVLREAAGDAPELSEYQRRFPLLASACRIQWEMDRLLASRRSRPAGGGAGGAGAASSVGRYQVQAVLGKGGMGVAYRAWDPQLKRVVALKTIRGADVGAEDVARFRGEAEAIACLRHPHIVQIYDVGEDAAGPFFAMEFCAGGSLAGRLKQQPLAPRAAAHAVEQIALGVAAAHQQHIVHRDLKPANVLIVDGPDPSEHDGAPAAAGRSTRSGRHSTRSGGAGASSGAGLPAAAVYKVADFGLAKHLDSDDGQTRTGAVMGTPAYMAPEQAFGETRKVGPAADVYALGAILYECLTGRPPFQGATVADTLDQARHRDPVPVRRLQPAAPVDLETIALKCLRKEPARRYPSAEALADDLRRFLDGRPILARATPWWERAWKWARRRPLVAAALAVAAAAVVGAVLVWASFTVELRDQRNLAEGNARTADQQRRRAEANQEQMLEAVDHFLSRVSDEKLKNIPGMEEVSKGLLADALAVLASLDRDTDDADPAVRHATGLALARSAKVHAMLGQFDRQGEHTLKALKVQRQLVAAFPAERKYRAELAKTLNNLGTWHQDASTAAGHFAAAVQCLEEARDLRRALADEQPGRPEPPADLARVLGTLGVAYRKNGQPAQAEAALRASLDLRGQLAAAQAGPQYQYELALGHRGLGTFCYYQSRFDEAETHLRAGVKIADDLVKQHDQAARYYDLLKSLYANLTAVYHGARKPAQGLDIARRNVALCRERARAFRAIPAYRWELATAYRNLGALLQTLDAKEFLESQQQHYTVLKELVRDFPEDANYRLDFATACLSLAIACGKADQAEAAVAHCQEGLDILEPLADKFGKHTGYALSRARGYLFMAELLAPGQPDPARRWYERGIAVLEDVLRREPNHPDARRLLAVGRNALQELSAK